jgi:hypothetical protein
MPDNLQDRGPADRARVNVNETHEARYWTQKSNCTAERLCAVIAKVGVMADAVERELGSKMTRYLTKAKPRVQTYSGLCFGQRTKTSSHRNQYGLFYWRQHGLIVRVKYRVEQQQCRNPPRYMCELHYFLQLQRAAKYFIAAVTEPFF